MNEKEALEKAKKILSNDDRELTVDDGNELLKLEPYISGDKFGNLIEGFYATAPFEVTKKFTELS